MACACFALNILFAGRNAKPYKMFNDIPADCQSWHQLSINPCSFAGKELDVYFGEENFCSTCSSFINRIEANIKLSLLARTVQEVLRFLSIFGLSFYF